MQSENIKDIFKTGGILFLITAISALVLALINGVTAPIIEANTMQKQADSMQTVFTDAADFALAQYDASDDSVSGVYLAKDSSGGIIGVCVSITTTGYGGDIDMIVGVNTERTVTGVDIINQSETAGLGTKAQEPEFKDQFIGKGKISKVVKSGASNNEIDAITSATITSKAVTKGVNTAIDAADSALSKEGL